MVEKGDWRLQGQERYLMGRKVRKTPFVRRSEQWDHEHCAFCMDKFSDRAGDLHEGYVADDPGENWICPTCFADFREMFHWELVEPGKE